MIKRVHIFLVALIFLIPSVGFSTHIVGGCITYVHTGDSTYLVTLKLYRDCGPGTSPLPDTAIISVVGNNGISFIPSRDIRLPLVSVTPVPSNLDSCNLPPNPQPCTEEGLYTLVVNNLPPNPGGYHLYYQLIARNWSLTNLNAVGNSVGESFYAYIPGTPVIWNEDFTLANGTTLDNGTTAWSSAAGTVPPASASVTNNLFQINGANSAQQSWTSQSINISAYPSGVSATVDLAANGALDPSDSIFVYYSINAGPLTLFSINGINTGNFGSSIAGQNGIVGNTVQFMIQVKFDSNSPNSERFRIDNFVISDTSFTANSNPAFTLFPPLFLCVGEAFTFDHSAIDVDGDSLAYSFYTPFDGDNGIGPLDPTFPNNTATFQPVNFLPGFSTINPLGGNPLNLNGTNGLLSGTPTALGQYVVGILVKEYRNGVYLSSTHRDFQFNVITCPQFVPAVLSPVATCNNNSVTFSNLGGGTGPGWLWNFGDPSTLADTSVLNSPSYTYPVAGNYTISLTTGFGTPCANTATTQLVLSSVIPKFKVNAPLCAGNTVSFTDSTQHSSNVLLNSWTWKFGDGTSSTLQNPTHIYASGGTYNVRLIVGSNTNCTDSITIPITIYDIPIANSVSSVSICDGATVASINFSSVPAGANFSWSNTNTSIGLAASGLGNIPAFSGINTSMVNQIANLTLVAEKNGCIGPPLNFSITVKPNPSIVAPPNQMVCEGILLPQVTPTSTPAGASFNWTNSNTAIGLASNGIGNVSSFTTANPSFIPISGNITITPVLNSCTGPSVVYTVTVNPLPTIATPSSQVVCSGTLIPGTNLLSTPAGASLSWTNSDASIGLAATGIGNVPAFTTSNLGASVLNGNITIIPTLASCAGNPISYSITVNPSPSFTAPPNQSYCDGQMIAGVSLTSIPAGAQFNWINNNTTVGLSASGSGTIPAFVSVNTGLNDQTASLTISLSLNTCVGQAQSYALTIHPRPAMLPTSNQTLCDGNATVATAFASTLPGATFSWLNNNSTIGLASSGLGNIPAFVTSNSTHSILSSTINVTPSLNGCAGNPANFTINVNPLPDVVVPQNGTFCEGSLVSPNAFSSLPVGATYTWSNTNTAIGLPANGVGNVASFISTNTSTAPILGNILVFPSLNGCIGPAANFTLTVQPKATISLPSDIKTCAEETIALSNFTSVPSSSNFSWINSNASIGLASFGVGNVPAFNTINNSGITQSSTITVTPSYQGCLGVPGFYKISVQPRPIADFTYNPNPTNIFNSTVFFTQTTQFASLYQWDFGDGNFSTEENPSHAYQDTGCYTIELIATNTAGCKDTAYQRLCVNGDFAIYVPNAFTPDGDGINDYFLPKGYGILESNYELQIFDRWGLFLFKSTNLVEGWNGKTSNLSSTGNAPIDTYVYKIQCRDISNKSHEFIGHITLLR